MITFPTNEQLRKGTELTVLGERVIIAHLVSYQRRGGKWRGYRHIFATGDGEEVRQSSCQCADEHPSVRVVDFVTEHRGWVCTNCRCILSMDE